MRQADGEFTRILEIEPAFDKRARDPKKNYGIHGVQMRWVLQGAEGAVQFLLYTNWQLPHVRKEWKHRGCGDYCLNAAMPADLGYHSKVPRYEGQQPMGGLRFKWVDGQIGDQKLKVPESEPTGTFEPCEYTGGPCYYDGSGLNAERVFDILTRDGEDGLWAELHRYYEATFREKVEA